MVLSELKIWDFHHYVQERVLFLRKHSHSLKLQYLFRAHVIFQFTHWQRRAVRYELGNVGKTWMVSAILGRCRGTPSWTKCRDKNYIPRSRRYLFSPPLPTVSIISNGITIPWPASHLSADLKRHLAMPIHISRTIYMARPRTRYIICPRRRKPLSPRHLHLITCSRQCPLSLMIYYPLPWMMEKFCKKIWNQHKKVT